MEQIGGVVVLLCTFGRVAVAALSMKFWQKYKVLHLAPLAYAGFISFFLSKTAIMELGWEETIGFGLMLYGLAWLGVWQIHYEARRASRMKDQSKN